MTKIIGALTACAAILLAPALARSQDEWQDEPAPRTPQPEQLPPAPPAETPAPPQPADPTLPPQPDARPAPRTQAVPPGQWVYTQQYGWIWMPYGDAYTQVPASGYGAPYAYAYYPAYGYWTWLAAPWVWGIGPWPVFGVVGPVHFAWYSYGYWRYPARWHYYAPHSFGAYGHAYRGGYGYGSRGYGYRGGWAPAPYRGAPAPFQLRSGVRPMSGAAAPFVGRGGGAGFARPSFAPAGRGLGTGAPMMHGGGGFAPRGGSGGGHGHGRGRG